MKRAAVVLVVTILTLVSDMVVAQPSVSVRLPVVMQTETSETTVVVERGDHLWKIAARHLEQTGSDQPIAPYWRSVVEINRDELRSGDPDLVYPGEVVLLPAP